MASVIANWTFRKLTDPCSVTSQTISVKQLDLDNCTVPRHLTIGTEILRDDKRSFRRPRMRANTLYNVSLTVNTKHKTYNEWKPIRTLETGKTFIGTHTVLYWLLQKENKV